MDTIYPNDDEIKFRKDNYGGKYYWERYLKEYIIIDIIQIFLVINN